eukprot:ctg_5231.g641
MPKYCAALGVGEPVQRVAQSIAERSM